MTKNIQQLECIIHDPIHSFVYTIWSLEIHLVNTYDHHLSPSSNMQIEQKKNRQIHSADF